MELNVKKEPLHIAELMFENTSEQSVDGDITLPDYCPDIKRILKCMVSPCLVSEQCTSDRVTIDANALVQVIYVDDNNEIFCYEKTFPFSKIVEFGKQIDNPTAEIRMKTAYANARAVSQRRIDIHASIAISVSISGKREIQLVSDASECGIQLFKNFNNASDFIGQTVKSFSLSEVMEIGKSKPPVRQIIRQKVTPNLSDIKVISNKLLVKGDVNINILYCADVSDGGYEVYENTMPVNQIIDLEGIDENSKYQSKLCLSSFNIVPKSNSSGEKKLLDVNISLTAVIKAQKEVDKCFPSDCYSTQCNLKSDKRMVSFEKIIDSYDDMIMIKKGEEFTNTTIGEIINVWCDDVVTTYMCTGDELKILGSTVVSILGKDDAGQPFYAERTVTFEKIKNIKDGCKDLICNSDGNISAVGFVLTDDNKIDLRVEIRLRVTLIRRNTAELLTDITCDETKPLNKKYSALTIYFCDDGELIWNIARKYNTTVDAIKLENELNENMIREKMMLLIPGA